MPQRFRILPALLFALVMSAASASTTVAAGDEVPGWLKQAAGASAPPYDRKVKAVVLLKEKSVTVASDGRVTTVTNYAVRILAREGRDEAGHGESYLTDSEKVREMRAWLIRPSGEVRKYGKDEVVDVALADNDIYNEARLRYISAEREVEEPGTVFGYTSTIEGRTVFTQETNPFQDDLPALVSRYTLTLPSGWRASGVIFNYSKVEPTVAGTTYTWELRNLAPIEREAAGPSLSALAPRLAISYYPAPGTQFSGRTFETWSDVARWMSEIEDPQANNDEAIAAKARELTAGASTELEKIQAIGRYVQNIRYISIQTDVGRGGGYRPRLATEVFAKAYGDCKDKANLMRSMLRTLKIESYLVSIYSGDPTFVRAEWPSPAQFNHCIIAIKVGDQTQAATIARHPRLGRLLIFDPTDENTPVGDLPHHEQGSLALIDSVESSELMQMPVTPPEANRLERTAEVTLARDGSITATLSDRASGREAVQLRRVFNWRSRPDFLKAVEHWIGAGIRGGAKLGRVEPVDNHNEGRFAVDVEFTAERYAQSMQDRLLVFKPAVVGRAGSVSLNEPKRTHPVVLGSEAFEETVRFKLPEGFAVDEIPDTVKISSEFGTYLATYEVKDGQLVFTRSLVQRASTVPAERYADVRAFFGRIRASEDSPVVLARK